MPWRGSSRPNRTSTQVYGAPGNVGMAGVATRLPVDAGDPQAVLDAAERERIDLTVVGPELPLDRGIVDLFAARGLR